MSKRFLRFCAASVFALLPGLAGAEGFGFLPPVCTQSGRQIDHLYLTIFGIVVALFVLTEGTLLFCVFFFRQRKGRKAWSMHGNNVAEVVWTIIPALILGYILYLSSSLWTKLRIDEPSEKSNLVVECLAEQFDWNFRYPGPDGVFGTPDDVMTVNELHIPVDRTVILKISSKDVIHSFFFPYARVKQDAVPGLLTKVWFDVDRMGVWNLATQKPELVTLDQYNGMKVALDGFDLKDPVVNPDGLRDYSYAPSAGIKQVPVELDGKITQLPPDQAAYVAHPYEIACAQLCGPGHFAMEGHVVVQTQADFDNWLKTAPDLGPTFRQKWNEAWDSQHPEFNKPNP